MLKLVLERQRNQRPIANIRWIIKKAREFQKNIYFCFIDYKKAGLNLNRQKTKIMASGPIPSWQIDGETMEPVTDFIFLGSLISVDGDYSHEMKRLLILGRKAMRNLDNILKSRNITLLTKVCVVKAMVFLVVMYGCESWTIRKAEH